MSRTISFKKEGYDPFIDYLKGIAILWVVMTHAITPIIHDYILFCLWGDLAVPVFLLIQCIHVYKKDSINNNVNIVKIWKRIIKPFLYIQLFLFILSIGYRYFSHKPVLEFVEDFVRSGGIGRGSYYVKMYLEFVLIIPLLYPLLRKNSKLGGAFLLFLSCLFEFLFSFLDLYLLWQWICFRYVIIIYLGYVIAKNGIILNIKNILLSIISIIVILVFQYSNCIFEPFFYDNPWKIFHWPIYFYVAYLLCFLLFVSFNRTRGLLLNVVLLMGKYSYEIFLFQMIIFYITDVTIRTYAYEHGYLTAFLYISFVVVFSISPVLIYKHFAQQEIKIT